MPFMTQMFCPGLSLIVVGMSSHCHGMYSGFGFRMIHSPSSFLIGPMYSQTCSWTGIPFRPCRPTHTLSACVAAFLLYSSCALAVFPAAVSCRMRDWRARSICSDCRMVAARWFPSPRTNASKVGSSWWRLPWCGCNSFPAYMVCLVDGAIFLK